MRRWDVERVDLAALGKCGSRIGLVSARASSACEVPVDSEPRVAPGGPNLSLAAILVTAVAPGGRGFVSWKRQCGVSTTKGP